MNLKLITTENFNGLDCNFYRNANDDILLTREQIGLGLGYPEPKDAIKKIHKRHKSRLDQFSVFLKLDKGGAQLVPSSGGEQETCLYTTKGVMEICRWSRQPKANDFMDFTWDVMDRIIHGDTVNMHGSVNFAEQQEFINRQILDLAMQQNSTRYKPDSQHQRRTEDTCI